MFSAGDYLDNGGCSLIHYLDLQMTLFMVLNHTFKALHAESTPLSVIISTRGINMIILHIKDFGDIKIELDRVNAPISANNFASLVSQGF